MDRIVSSKSNNGLL